MILKQENGMIVCVIDSVISSKKWISSTMKKKEKEKKKIRVDENN